MSPWLEQRATESGFLWMRNSHNVVAQAKGSPPARVWHLCSPIRVACESQEGQE